jgi:hypothetical protein
VSSTAGDCFGGGGAIGCDDLVETCRGRALLFVCDGEGVGGFCLPDWETVGRVKAKSPIEIEQSVSADARAIL